MRYKHVLFDLDGTIFDTYEANMIGLLIVLDKYLPGHNETYESLGRFFGIPGHETLKHLGISSKDHDEAMSMWIDEVLKRDDKIKPFDNIIEVIKELKYKGVHLGIITSRVRQDIFKGNVGDFMPDIIKPYFSLAVCANDVPRPKPYPDSILHYMELTGAKREEIIFIGDALTDMQCAHDAGVDFAVAMWGCAINDYFPCKEHLNTPFDILSVCFKEQENFESDILRYSRELQAIGQIGIAYSKDRFDTIRYERIRQIAMQMIATYTNTPYDKVHDAIGFDRGYITPKIDTRAAIFNEKGEILLVKEASGLYSLPGGWCEDGLSIYENVVKEAKEEACVDVQARSLIALLNRNCHNQPKYLFGVIKAFVLCSNTQEHDFISNDETIDRAYFAEDRLPLDKLRLSTNTKEQISLCFRAYNDPKFYPVID